MKKIMISLCAVTMFSAAAIAQVEEDTTRSSNNLTDMQQSPEAQRDEDTERGAENPADSVQQGVERTGSGIQQGAEETREETNDTLRRNADEAENEIQEGVQSSEGALREEADRAGNAAQEAAENTEDAVEEGANRVDKTLDPAKDPMKSEKVEQSDNNAMEANAAAAPLPGSGPQIEVVESKEGPMNEVVYKYNGEMFYIDRESSSIVKVDGDSDLNDVGENKIVHKKDKKK